MKKPKKPPGYQDPEEALRKTPEFQNFEEAMRQIVKVPKEEADKRVREGQTGVKRK